MSIIESFRFWDEDDFEYEIFSILSTAHEPWTSVILVAKRDSRRNSTKGFKSRSGVNRSSNVKSFIILRSEEGLTFFSINNPTNFFGEKN